MANLNVIIYYFSATSNTKKVTKMLTEHLQDRDVHVTMLSIEDIKKPIEFEETNSCDLLGLAYPIYGLSTPSIMYEFIKLLPEKFSGKVFLLQTAGDFITMNQSASRPFIKRLREKGYDVFYDRIVAMGSNWFLNYDDRVVKQLHKVAKLKTKHMAKELLEVKYRMQKKSAFWNVIAKCVGFMEKNVGAKYFGKSLYANEACTNCGKCYHRCPMGNIHHTDEGIKFGKKCIWCMRCIYNCPEDAIESKYMRFCILKPHYNLKRVIEDDSISDIMIDANTKGFYKHFYPYIIDESK